MLARQDVERLRVARPEDATALRPIPGSRLIKEPPSRVWMVEDCFTPGNVAIVAGDGGIGKSLLMQQMLTSACLGRPWLGLATQRGRGLFFACEDDDDELHRRQWSICNSLGCCIEDVIDAGLDLVPRVGRENTLSRLDRKAWRMEPTPLFEGLAAHAIRHGCSYVVIDTATQTFAGNQNDEQQVMQFVNQLRRLAVAIQGVVIITKHPSMAGRALGTGESGNVAWNNSVRARLYLHKDKGGNLNLETMKSNYARSGAKVPVRWERGAFVLDRVEARDYTATD